MNNDLSEKISIKEAIEILKENGLNITPETLRSWCKSFNLGIQIGGNHRGNKRYLFKEDINKILTGEIFIQRYKEGYFKNKQDKE